MLDGRVSRHNDPARTRNPLFLSAHRKAIARETAPTLEDLAIRYLKTTDVSDAGSLHKPNNFNRTSLFRLLL